MLNWSKWSSDDYRVTVGNYLYQVCSPPFGTGTIKAVLYRRTLKGHYEVMITLADNTTLPYGKMLCEADALARFTTEELVNA